MHHFQIGSTHWSSGRADVGLLSSTDLSMRNVRVRQQRARGAAGKLRSTGLLAGMLVGHMSLERGRRRRRVAAYIARIRFTLVVFTRHVFLQYTRRLGFKTAVMTHSPLGRARLGEIDRAATRDCRPQRCAERPGDSHLQR